jgi:hypothetical protein
MVRQGRCDWAGSGRTGTGVFRPLDRCLLTIRRQARSLPGLIQGARADHLAGLIYFDVSQHNTSPAHQQRALTPASMGVLRENLAR